MNTQLLHVLSAQTASIPEAQNALRAMRRACPADTGGRKALLLCALPPSDTAAAEQDDAVIRCLQSGVMAAGKQYALLVPSRIWSGAEGAYVSPAQNEAGRRLILSLLMTGEADMSFRAATVSPASLKNRFSFVLFSDAGQTCTPDTPLSVLRALEKSGLPSIGARVRVRAGYPHSVLARLEQTSFSLCSAESARMHRLARARLAQEDAPRMFALKRLSRIPEGYIPCREAEGCVFIREPSSSICSHFAALYRRMLAGKTPVCPAPAQLLLLFLLARLGMPLPAFAVILLPELQALLRPSLLPGALVRLALLPVTALAAADAQLQRLSSRSPRFSLRLSAQRPLPGFAAACGALLIAAAFCGTHALPLCLPVSLLWLSAPLTMRALDMPTIERIPLKDDERARLRALAESACFDALSAAEEPAFPAFSVLCACAGCMLGLLEPDEAARRVQGILSGLSAGAQTLRSASAQAALLTGAQFLREQMGSCDAALRPLPPQLENLVLAAGAPESGGRLGRLIRAAHGAAPLSLRESDAPADALFLPLPPARISSPQPGIMPLTHPHTYLRRLDHGYAPRTGDPCAACLALTAAALDHPFYPLLLRSPVAGPYMPLLDI